MYRIPILKKQEGKWWAHCAVGSGCRIYEDRLSRAFLCLWLQDMTMQAEWKPEISKMVLSIYPTPGFIYAQVNSVTPLAWRKEPYFSPAKNAGGAPLKERRHLLFFVNGNATLIMPTGPVPIGPMSPDDGFVVRETFTPAGKDYVAKRVARDVRAGARR